MTLFFGEDGKRFVINDDCEYEEEMFEMMSSSGTVHEINKGFLKNIKFFENISEYYFLEDEATNDVVKTFIKYRETGKLTLKNRNKEYLEGVYTFANQISSPKMIYDFLIAEQEMEALVYCINVIESLPSRIFTDLIKIDTKTFKKSYFNTICYSVFRCSNHKDFFDNIIEVYLRSIETYINDTINFYDELEELKRRDSQEILKSAHHFALVIQEKISVKDFFKKSL